MMQLQKYSDMGAIDAVFKQFVPGKKDHSTYQTPKLGSSISHAYGKADDLTMVEIFGARGQDLSYPEMKWWTDLMQVAGVNFLIPHSFNPRARTTRIARLISTTADTSRAGRSTACSPTTPAG